MKRLILSSILIISLASWSCKSIDETYPIDLEGEWTIVHSTRLRIFNNGNVEVFEDKDNAGTLNIYDDPEAISDLVKKFDFDYTNYANARAAFTRLLFTDEEATRIFFSKALCDSPFDCDIVWTVDENKKNRQVWSAYGDQTGYFYGERYDPSNDNYHLKWTITLER